MLNYLAELGFPKSSYGLHSLRSGGASAAANDTISDRLFKRHGRLNKRSLMASFAAIVCLNGMVVGSVIVLRTAILFFQFLVR